MTERKGDKWRRKKEVLVRTELFDKAPFKEQGVMTESSEESSEGLRLSQSSPASKLGKKTKHCVLWGFDSIQSFPTLFDAIKNGDRVPDLQDACREQREKSNRATNGFLAFDFHQTILHNQPVQRITWRAAEDMAVSCHFSHQLRMCNTSPVTLENISPCDCKVGHFEK